MSHTLIKHIKMLKTSSLLLTGLALQLQNEYGSLVHSKTVKSLGNMQRSGESDAIMEAVHQPEVVNRPQTLRAPFWTSEPIQKLISRRSQKGSQKVVEEEEKNEPEMEAPNNDIVQEMETLDLNKDHHIEAPHNDIIHEMQTDIVHAMDNLDMNRESESKKALPNQNDNGEQLELCQIDSHMWSENSGNQIIKSPQIDSHSDMASENAEKLHRIIKSIKAPRVQQMADYLAHGKTHVRHNKERENLIKDEFGITYLNMQTLTVAITPFNPQAAPSLVATLTKLHSDPSLSEENIREGTAAILSALVKHGEEARSKSKTEAQEDSDILVNILKLPKHVLYFLENYPHAAVLFPVEAMDWGIAIIFTDNVDWGSPDDPKNPLAVAEATWRRVTDLFVRIRELEVVQQQQNSNTDSDLSGSDDTPSKAAIAALRARIELIRNFILELETGHHKFESRSIGLDNMGDQEILPSFPLQVKRQVFCATEENKAKKELVELAEEFTSKSCEIEAAVQLRRKYDRDILNLRKLQKKTQDDFMRELALTPQSEKNMMDLNNGTGALGLKGEQILQILDNANAMKDKLTREFADKLPIIQASVEKNMPEYHRAIAQVIVAQQFFNIARKVENVTVVWGEKISHDVQFEFRDGPNLHNLAIHQKSKNPLKRIENASKIQRVFQADLDARDELQRVESDPETVDAKYARKIEDAKNNLNELSIAAKKKEAKKQAQHEREEREAQARADERSQWKSDLAELKPILQKEQEVLKKQKEEKKKKGNEKMKARKDKEEEKVKDEIEEFRKLEEEVKETNEMIAQNEKQRLENERQEKIKHINEQKKRRAEEEGVLKEAQNANRSIGRFGGKDEVAIAVVAKFVVEVFCYAEINGQRKILFEEEDVSVYRDSRDLNKLKLILFGKKTDHQVFCGEGLLSDLDFGKKMNPIKFGDPLPQQKSTKVRHAVHGNWGVAQDGLFGMAEAWKLEVVKPKLLVTPKEGSMMQSTKNANGSMIQTVQSTKSGDNNTVDNNTPDDVEFKLHLAPQCEASLKNLESGNSANIVSSEHLDHEFDGHAGVSFETLKDNITAAVEERGAALTVQGKKQKNQKKVAVQRHINSQLASLLPSPEDEVQWSKSFAREHYRPLYKLFLTGAHAKVKAAVKKAEKDGDDSILKQIKVWSPKEPARVEVHENSSANNTNKGVSNTNGVKSSVFLKRMKIFAAMDMHGEVFLLDKEKRKVV